MPGAERLMAALFWSAAVVLIPGVSQAVAQSDFRQHLQKGRYAEAISAAEVTAKSAPTAATVVGLARAYRATGRDDDALKTLRAAVEMHADWLDVQAELADLHWSQGRLDDAATIAEQILASSPDQLLARLVSARVAADRGDFAAAEEGFRWFVRFYNRVQPKSAEDLLFTGIGAAEYARMKGVGQVFNFVVNTLCTDIEKVDPLCWEGRLLAGSLLLEKYNRGQGVPELKAALAINPQAADVLVRLGDSEAGEMNWESAERQADAALAINARHPGALRLKIDCRLAVDQPQEVPPLLERLLAVNRVDQRNLARLAVVRMLDREPPLDRWKTLLGQFDQAGSWQVDDRFPVEAVLQEVARTNPRPGTFLQELGTWMASRRQFAVAEQVYQAAIKATPHLSTSRASLGQMYLQIGRVDDARDLLDAAFKTDPYHVRVSNLRKVIRVLDGYDKVVTPHFVIRVDSKLDKLLARYAAEYLETAYAELTAQYGYEPPQKTQIEFYNDANGLPAHQWFSARMVGLPWIQTIGASTGLMIAMTSPTALDQHIHWGRVLRHELVHVITLQQTDFQIPHWYTEALAMRAEQSIRPAEWDTLLQKRVAENRLRNLSTLTEGFVRAGNREEWNFAYCQSALYADFMVELGGEAALATLLDAYRNRLTTPAAIEATFGMPLDEFERKYRTFLDARVAAIAQRDAEEPSRSPAEIEQAHRDDPENADTGAKYAMLLWKTGRREAATTLAMKLTEREPIPPLAALVVAEAALQNDQRATAADVLTEALDRKAPHPQLLARLASLRLDAGEWSQARELCQLGRQTFPHNATWAAGLAKVGEETGDRTLWRESLAVVVTQQPDDASARRQLAQLFLEDQNWEQARALAQDALLIDVLSAQTHLILAQAFAKLQQPEKALVEFETVWDLSPGDDKLLQPLVELAIELGQTSAARRRLQPLLEKRPNDPHVQSLLKKLE